ncbi:MAG TPA: outer membrane beta-barrel protein [Kofleriaceae bacterium]|nr:outer membrane beta-barrel protein [Kofleriaceae bacterium]
MGARFYAGGYRGGYRGGYYGGYRGYRGGWWGGGHVWVGGYAPWWPSYYYYGPEYVPSYYGSSYYPVQPGAAAYAGPSAYLAPPPPLPRLGIGVFGGAVNSDLNMASNTQETDFGLLGRFRLTDGLLVEGELGKTSYEVNNVSDVRQDRRLGGSLIYEFGARNAFAPYVLAGLGVQQADVGGTYSTTQDYGELGLGLRLALTPHFHLTFDVRAGSRSTVSNDSATAMPTGSIERSVTPPTSSSGNDESYTRARLAAIYYF